MENKRLRNLCALVVLLAILLAGCSSPRSSGALNTPSQTDLASDLPSGSRNSAVEDASKTGTLSIVRAFNTALTGRDFDSAMQFLGNDIVLVDRRASGCIHEIVTGWHDTDAFLRNPAVLSRVASDYRVEGNRVFYRLTEWLDPRIVGPNYPQPRVSQVVAVAEYNQIFSLIIAGDAEWRVRRDNSVNSRIDPCGSHFNAS